MCRAITFPPEVGYLKRVTQGQIQAWFDSVGNETNDLCNFNFGTNTWTNPANGVPFMFSDGTTIGMNPVQRVSFIGASYIYRLP